MKEYIEHLEEALRLHHPKVLGDLQPGASRSSGALNEWFGWRNGQAETTKELLFGLYRFVPEQEARTSLKLLRSQAIGNPASLLALTIFAPRSLFSIPLLADGAGDGYYFNLLTGSVFHRFEGERSTVFRSFTHFVDYLVELVGEDCVTEEQIFEREVELLEAYRK